MEMKLVTSLKKYEKIVINNIEKTENESKNNWQIIDEMRKKHKNNITNVFDGLVNTN